MGIAKLTGRFDILRQDILALVAMHTGTGKRRDGIDV